jgi:hypothetical protein
VPILLLRQRVVMIAVADVETAADSLLDVVQKLGGELEARTGQRLVVHVPEAKLRDLSAVFVEKGAIKSQTASAEDASERAADLMAALRAADERKKGLESLLGRARSVDESLLIERRLAEVEQKTSALRTELSALKRKAAAVRVEITLVSPPVEPIPGVQLPFPWLRTLSGSELRNPSAPPEDSSDAGGIYKNADLALELEGRLLRDRPAVDEVSRALALVLRLRGAQADPVGFAAGYDVKLGGLDGVVYEMRGLGGLSTAIGSVLTVGLLGGAGVSGWTGDRVPSSLEIPVELFTLVDFGDAVRLSLFAQPRWTVTRDARRDGAEHGLWADELALGGALLIPQIFGEERIDEGGLRVGFEYTELLSHAMYAVSVGVGFGIPSRR